MPKKLVAGVYTTSNPLTTAVPCVGACAIAMLVIGPVSLAETLMLTAALAGVLAASFTTTGTGWLMPRVYAWLPVKPKESVAVTVKL